MPKNGQHKNKLPAEVKLTFCSYILFIFKKHAVNTEIALIEI